jgi:hyperosmotically inducible periplasmic protein
MKKLIPFLVSSVLLVGAVGCQDASKTSDAGGAGTDAPASKVKEAASTTQTAAQKGGSTAVNNAKTKVTNAAGGVKTIVKNRLEEKFPGSKLDVTEANGVVTVKGTVPNAETLKKIEPAIKEYKFQGVKTVKVEATVAAKKP